MSATVAVKVWYRVTYKTPAGLPSRARVEQRTFLATEANRGGWESKTREGPDSFGSSIFYCSGEAAFEAGWRATPAEAVEAKRVELAREAERLATARADVLSRLVEVEGLSSLCLVAR